MYIYIYMNERESNYQMNHFIGKLGVIFGAFCELRVFVRIFMNANNGSTGYVFWTDRKSLQNFHRKSCVRNIKKMGRRGKKERKKERKKEKEKKKKRKKKKKKKRKKKERKERVLLFLFNRYTHLKFVIF